MHSSDEAQQIVDAVRDFSQSRLKPFSAEWDRESRFPAEAVREMGEPTDVDYAEAGVRPDRRRLRLAA